MKKFITAISAILFGMGVFAQDDTRISISSVLPDDTGIPEESLSMFQNKMKAIVLQNGYADEIEQRFVLTASVDVIEKNRNFNGALMQKMAVTFYVGDVLENKIYSTSTINTVGVGQSDIKVYNMAFQRLSPSAPQIVKMLDDARAQIVDYYTNHYDDILVEVNRMVKMGDYDGAMTKLVTIPSVCKETYKAAQDYCVDIYLKKVAAEKVARQEQMAAQKAELDHQGRVYLQQAKAAWASRQDYETASAALDILAQVDPAAECIEECNEFIRSISDKLRADEKKQAAAEAAAAQRNWEFKMRKYEDDLVYKTQGQANRAEIFGVLANRFGRVDITYQKDKTKRWGVAKTK